MQESNPGHFMAKQEIKKGCSIVGNNLFFKFLMD